MTFVKKSTEIPYWWRITSAADGKKILLQPIRSTTQIWVVTRHQYGISVHVSQTSFREETIGGITKRRLIIKLERGWVIEQDFPWNFPVSFRWVFAFFSLAGLTESCSFGYDSKDNFPFSSYILKLSMTVRTSDSQVVRRTRVRTGGSSVNGIFH